METATPPDRTWKVGALARATGLTVRALHYYGVREYGARDPEGQLWFFQSPSA